MNNNANHHNSNAPLLHRSYMIFNTDLIIMSDGSESRCAVHLSRTLKGASVVITPRPEYNEDCWDMSAIKNLKTCIVQDMKENSLKGTSGPNYHTAYKTACNGSVFKF